MNQPDVTYLERLVSQGRLSEALEGYQQLLEARPDDNMLRARVQMLQEAVTPANTSGPWASIKDAPPPSDPTPFNITQAEVAEGYVLAGRYQDAVALLHRLIALDPQDAGLAARLAYARKMQAHAADEAVSHPEYTSPHGVAVVGAAREAGPHEAQVQVAASAPQAALAPPKGKPGSDPPRPAVQRSAGPRSLPISSSRNAVAFGVPRSVPGEAPVAPRGAPGPFGQPRSVGGARNAAARRRVPDTVPDLPRVRQETQPTTPLMSDVPAMVVHEERTIRSVPTAEELKRAGPPLEATVVAAPPALALAVSRGAVRMPGARGGSGRPTDERSTTSDSASQETDEGDDPNKTLLAPVPSGLDELLQDPAQLHRPVVQHEERTAFGPPPQMDEHVAPASDVPPKPKR